MTEIDDTQDVVGFLTAQHDRIKELFAEVDAASGKAREQAFVHLRRLLAVHETAEEEVVHPRARRELHNGDGIVNARLHEEQQAKTTLTELEGLDVDSSEFATLFATLRRDVLAHAEAEEREEFPRLEEQLDDGRLARMRHAVELAEKTAPTRPHPGVELAGENMLAGPFAAMLDRARDLISGKH